MRIAGATPRGITAPGHDVDATGTRAEVVWCSTPRGITAPGHGHNHSAAERTTDVLNASRHHRPEALTAE
jgi:hypothetical protein